MRKTKTDVQDSSPVTIVEKHNSLKRFDEGVIAIRPYVESNIKNMGLERYEQSLFDGVFHEEQLACLEINGIKRYLSGLDEYAPEVKNIKDEDQRQAVIKNIRKIVAEAEKEFAANDVDVDDPDFWKKVMVLRPQNSEFWDKIFLRCGNEPVFLNPSKDIYDMIKVTAIEAGGFSMVAKNLEDARSRPKPPKFYLDKNQDTAASRTELKKLKNKALAELEELFNTNQNKLFYVAKILDPNPIQYKKKTPTDILYDNMDKFINGELIEKDKRKAPQKFLDVVKLDMESLKLNAIIKDANILRLIASKPDGQIYHMDSGVPMGKTPSDVLLYIKNPMNQDILKNLMEKVEKNWN